MRQEGEPSVEEILESIKQVIARDNRDTLQRERTRREAPYAEPTVAEPADEEEAEEVLDLGDAADELPESDEPAEDTSLIAETAARSMRESLDALAVIAEPGARPQIVRSGETSLEGLTRDLLRPMLAEWLEQNLPEMVERLVKAEIARIAGKKG
jgi:cell pole-organizing protein PopZ